MNDKVEAAVKLIAKWRYTAEHSPHFRGPENADMRAQLRVCANELETILAELGRLSGAPAGWKLVPIEPNWDMRNEGREFLIDGLEKDYERIAYFLWKTMVNASPAPPTKEQP